MRNFLFHVVLVSALPALAFSQGAPPSPESLARENLTHQSWMPAAGLPIDRIKDIAQTKDGYLWLGTTHGLARFDGVRFTFFNRANSSAFASEDCWTLAVDDDDALWIATPNGLLAYSGGRFRSYGIAEGFTDPFIGAMTFGPKTGLWVGTQAGLSRYFHGAWTTLRITPGGLAGRVMRLHEDHSGNLWVGTIRGLQILDPQTARFKALTPTHAYSSDSVLGIHTEPDGAAWVLYHAEDPASFHWMHFSNGRAVEINEGYSDLNGRTLLASPHAVTGSWHVSDRWRLGEWIRIDDWTAVQLPVPPHDVVLSLLEDREGALWAGTQNRGLHRFRLEHRPITRLYEGLPDPSIWAVGEDASGQLWLGTDKGLVRKAGGQLTVYNKQNGLSDDFVRALAFDPQGRVWIGTTDGLDVFENHTLRAASIPGHDLGRKVRAIVCARDESVWLGTEAGVFHLSAGTWTSLTVTNGLGDNRAPVLLEDAQGDVWIGTLSGGLHRWHQGTLTRFTTKEGLPSDQITALTLDSHQVLWIGTDQGIGRFEAGEFKITTTPADGPINTPVRSIIEDDSGYLWIYCAAGFYGARREDLLHPETRAAEQFITRFPLDGPWMLQPGVPKAQPVGWKTHDGRVLFGSSEGLVMIQPREFVHSFDAPPVVIEQVIASGETLYSNAPVGFDGQPTPRRAPGVSSVLKLLPGYGRHLAFHFTENSFSKPEEIRFKYRMEGVDKEWVHAGFQRVAHYDNLSPGRYVFRVMAGDAYSDFKESLRSFEIELAGRLYEARWFQALLALTVGLGLFGVLRWRLIEMRKVQDLRRHLAVTGERTRLARDLHDQLGAEITRAARLTERLDGMAVHQAAPEKLRLRESLRAMRYGIDAAVWAIAPEKDCLTSLIDFTADRAQSLLEGTGVELDLQLPESRFDCPLPPEFRHELATTVLEAVNNALRHAQPRHVRLAFALDERTLRVEIADDGCGFDLQDNGPLIDGRNHFARLDNRTPLNARLARNGISTMRARIAALGGTITIDSRPNQGTCVTVQAPLPGPISKPSSHP